MREMDDREDAAPSDLDQVVRAARELAEDLRRQEQHLIEDFKVRPPSLPQQRTRGRGGARPTLAPAQDLYARFEEAYNGIKVARKKAAEVLCVQGGMRQGNAPPRAVALTQRGDRGSFRRVEELEDEYTEGVNKLLDGLLQQFADEKLKADELATEVFVVRAAALVGGRRPVGNSPPGACLLQMLQSRDVAKAAVNNSHDNHLGQILSVVRARCGGAPRARRSPRVMRPAQEGDKSEALATEVREILERYTEEEHQRNRQRMVEIRNFVQSVQRRVGEYIAREFPESD